MKIYLAGPDVFRPDAAAFGRSLQALCSELGLTGCFPLDNEMKAELSGQAAARAIYEANVAMIRDCDAVMANLNPFRGREPDSGTAFEVGYAAALGKEIWVYTSEPRNLVEQWADTDPVLDGPQYDDAGMLVEDFGMNLNLMLACSSAHVVIGTAHDCLRRIAARQLSEGKE
ncbi:nucleoside deoxyribosyltransferase [Pigmentiphaga litoralis]|uniref:nucleoside 2-deoxyribosyltransferase n=1 Tax=Pigmentiphaga litoralis TaxID=516702 RepID=UPI00167350B5|nr:nucleoside 2-deoxyribosyltransferase [Pigmentiphaga litoralis]GGX19463.1 nucleoside deoxyribosyltransferase [Pigmentiphaga litoralis]